MSKMNATYIALIQQRVDLEKAVMQKFKMQDLKHKHPIKYLFITIIRGGV